MSTNVTIRFFGALNDFLPAAQRNCVVHFPLDEHAAVKHPIEALGVPHPEVELIVVDGQSVDFGHQIHAGMHIQVYGVDAIEQATVTPPDGMRLRPELPRPIRFVADVHLGQLAAYLRMLGFDTLYRNDYEDPELARLSATLNRVLLTRDRGLLKRKMVVHGYCVRGTQPRQQLLAVFRRYRLAPQAQPWTRCARCNGALIAVEKEAILTQLEPKTRLYYHDFRQCTECGQLFWEGAHFQRMQAFVEWALTRSEDAA